MISSELGFFPEAWSLCKVNSLFNIQQGKSVSKDNRKGSNQKPFLRTKNVFWGKIDVTELDHMNFSDNEELKLELHKGDLLLCEGGDVGRAAIWNNQIADCYYQNHLHRLRVIDKQKLIPQFALYWFWYAFKVANLYIGRSNVTTIPNMSQSKLGGLLLPTPPLEEQQHIVRILSTLQTINEQQKRMITLTQEFKFTIMHKLFTEGLRGEAQKQTDVGLIPHQWKQLRLEQTGDVIYGIQSAVANNYEPIGTKILTNKNINLDGQIVLEDVNYFELKTKRHFDSILQKGDILFNWRSGSKEHIGKTAFFDLDGEYTHSSFILRIRPNKDVNGKFLFYYLYYLRASGYFLQKHDISSVNATFNKSAVDSLLVFLPSKKEQDEIASILDILDEKIILSKQKQDLYLELFRTLLNKLMTGQIRVNDLRIEDSI